MLYDDLLDQVVLELQNHVNIDANKVARGRVNALQNSDYPYYAVFLGSDAPLSDLGASNTAYIDWDVEVLVECYSRGKDEEIDRLVLEQRANVHEALMDDVTQGLNFVHTTIPIGGEQPVLDGEGRQRNAVYQTTWVFRIRTNIDQIRTFP